MLSKSKIKFIQSLELKKFRDQYRCFLAEGNKLVDDTYRHFNCEMLIATEEWLDRHPNLRAGETIATSRDEIKKASLLKSPQEVMAVYSQPEYPILAAELKNSLSLALDTIQDPGNLGTIVRLADWFGINDVFCSPGCADIYGPKAVQATMGALARVRVHYLSLETFLPSLDEFPIYGTFLDGENLYDQTLSPTGIIVMGNEGNGISPDLAPFIDKRLYIPSYPPEQATSESLNVAIATAVICAEFRRRR